MGANVSCPPARMPHAPSMAIGRSAAHFTMALAVAAIVVLYGVHTWNSSRVIDGIRWFWLDDDMMISMRYARNLVSGAGLVFNPGERVEGYTNFGWVLLMAGVHLLPLPDQLTSVAMRALSMSICV